jgi:hypothetical protein
MKELIVPIRDRRQQRRILTLKNFRNALLVLVSLFAGVTIAAHLRRPNHTDDFGRLYGRQLPSATVKQPEIVREGAPIADANSADPMLVAPQARAQLLLADSNVPAKTTIVAPAIQSVAPIRSSGERVTVVGGPEGVSIVKQSETRPVLAGGFMRQ